MIDLRLGRWQDVLADVECDAVICDPPFGERTHVGYRSGVDAGLPVGKCKRPIEFEPFTHEDVAALVMAWSQRTRSWIVAMTSHDLIGSFASAFADAGMYSFAPVPCIIVGAPRLGGDGPASSAVYLMVARQRRADIKPGSLPGYYTTGTRPIDGGGRGKPLDLMRAIVRDYSRPGDLVCDPFAGHGTTARACASLGRRFVGAECDADAYAEAQRRLADVVTVDVQGVQRVRQGALL